jgi:hypothetical protein
MSGQRNVADIARAIESGRVRTLTSPGHIFAQSKLAFARAWAQGASGVVPETHELTETDRDAIARARASWVVKRCMGRVGDQVFVGELHRDDEWASIVDRARLRGTRRTLDRPALRQTASPADAVGRPLRHARRLRARRRFAGYFARITPQSHVSHDALCVPVFVSTPPEEERR